MMRRTCAALVAVIPLLCAAAVLADGDIGIVVGIVVEQGDEAPDLPGTKLTPFGVPTIVRTRQTLREGRAS